MSEKYLTAQELAEKFSVSSATVRRRVNDGLWPSTRIGNRYRFSPDQVNQIQEMSEVEVKHERNYSPEKIKEALRRLS